jgi:type VI secretion system protein ImpC
LGTADYVKWRAFRQTDDSRYIGLTLPRFMLRLPYGADTVPVQSFNYTEDVKGTEHDNYLWGNASFAFGSSLVNAFTDDGWCVQIRGPQSGGRIDNLPVHVYDVGRGQEVKIPVEVPVDETLEYTCADLGFIPFSHYTGKDYACFFSANSAQEPKIYEEEDATANSRINSRMPYIFLASRIAHHLKVLQRENIGATKDAQAIEEELNDWIGKLVTKMTNPGPEQVVKYPLRDASVSVQELEDNPGYYRVGLKIIPHFQVEGMDVSLSLVGKI